MAVAKKVYVAQDGTETRSFKPDAARLEFRFIGDDGESVVNTATVIPSEYPENVQTAAMWHGFAQKLGDAYAGAKKAKRDPFEMFEEMNESLMEGTWVAEGESAGPRTTLVLEALVIVAAQVKKVNLDKMSEEDLATWKAELAKTIQTKEQKAGALKDPRIDAEYKRLQAERAAARAKEAAEAAAKGAGENDFFAGLEG